MVNIASTKEVRSELHVLKYSQRFNSINDLLIEMIYIYKLAKGIDIPLISEKPKYNGLDPKHKTGKIYEK